MSSQAHVAGAHQSKGEQGPNPGHDDWVRLLPLLSNHVAQSLEKNMSRLAAATSSAEYQREERRMLHLADPLFIWAAFQLLVLGVDWS